MTLRVSGGTATEPVAQSTELPVRVTARLRLGLRLAGVTHWQISDDHDAVTVIRRRRTQIMRHDNITSNLLVLTSTSTT